MTGSSEYRKAYEKAQRELADLISQQQALEKRIVTVRQSIQTLATLCESEDVEVESSAEAAYLLEHSTLADEIRSILSSQYPDWLRATVIKSHLERLGHDLSHYRNPLATIHMILKRGVESGDVQEDQATKAYRRAGIGHKLARLGSGDEAPRGRIILKDLGAIAGRYKAALDPEKLPDEIAGLLGKGKKK